MSNAVCLLGSTKEGNGMRRRILLVDDEVAVLLTLKAVLEISGFAANSPLIRQIDTQILVCAFTLEEGQSSRVGTKMY